MVARPIFNHIYMLERRVSRGRGDLVFAPKELQYSVFCDAIPLLEIVGGRKTIIVSPIPRYLVLGCCPDPDHAGNRSSPDFRCGLESAVIECRKNVKDFCFRHGLRNVRVIGPWPALRAMGNSVWVDAVHLTGEGYSKVAELVQGAARELAEKPVTEAVRSGKRPHDDSGPSGGYGKRGWTPASQVPYWQSRGRRRY